MNIFKLLIILLFVTTTCQFVMQKPISGSRTCSGSSSSSGGRTSSGSSSGSRTSSGSGGRTYRTSSGSGSTTHYYFYTWRPTSQNKDNTNYDNCTISYNNDTMYCIRTNCTNTIDLFKEKNKNETLNLVYICPKLILEISQIILMIVFISLSLFLCLILSCVIYKCHLKKKNESS